MSKEHYYKACERHDYLSFLDFYYSPKYFCKECWINYFDENGWSKGVDDLDNFKKEVTKMFSSKDNIDDLKYILFYIEELKEQYIRDRHDLAYFILNVYDIKKYEDVFSDVSNRFEILDL